MSDAKPLKIALGSSSGSSAEPVVLVRPILADFQREAHEVTVDPSFVTETNPRGIALVLKFPGLSPVTLGLDHAEDLAERIQAPEPPADSPVATFLRTATVDRDGNLSGQFSYEKRSRVVTIPEDERAGVADFIAALKDRAVKAIDEYEAKQNAEKTPAAAPEQNAGQNTPSQDSQGS